MRLSRIRKGQRSGWHEDPRVEGPLADLISGVMWTITAVVGLAVLVLPGTAGSHLGWTLGLGAFALGWGVVSIGLGVRGWTMPIGWRAVVTGATMPVVALGLWATGGAESYLQPILLFTALFLAYFFPRRLAWPLVALFACAYATPLLYDSSAGASQYPARLAAFVVAIVGETLAMQFLKRRLLTAEARQRRIAARDPLTGVANRRGFDAALERALATVTATRAHGHDSEAQQAALLLFDFNDFKLINDLHGHPVGDTVLRAVAEAGRGLVRDGDCLARVGGDEFAIVAPGAGHDGAMRLLETLDRGIREADVPSEVGAVEVSFGWAVAPIDGSDPKTLLLRADERLLMRKRSRAAAQPAVGRPAV